MSAAETNVNCLVGMACPACETTGPFRIVVNAWATVTDGGVDALDEVAWDDDAPCRCAGCGHTGTVAAFHALPQLGGRYLERVTSDRPLTDGDERLVRDLLDGSPGYATGGDTTP